MVGDGGVASLRTGGALQALDILLLLLVCLCSPPACFEGARPDTACKYYFTSFTISASRTSIHWCQIFTHLVNSSAARCLRGDQKFTRYGRKGVI